MDYNFPEIKTTRTEEECVQKIIDEINEFLQKPSDEEAVDILHSVETFVRKRFASRELILNDVISSTIKKNSVRGYYTRPCF